MFICIKYCITLLAVDNNRNDFIFELTGFDCCFSFALGSYCEFILHLSCDTIFLSNVFCCNTHMILIESIPQTIVNHNVDHLRIVHSCTPTSTWNCIWSSTHVFCTTADNDFRFACKNLVSCKSNALQSRTTNNIDCHSCCLNRKTCF